MVSSMFEAGATASEPVEQFSTWLLVGTAAIASFLITNADKLLPLVGRGGFRVLGAFLCISCVCGLVARTYALRCKVGIGILKAVGETFRKHLEKYEKEEREIQDGAKFWGITLQTGIRMERVLSEFFAPLPKWIVWVASRKLKRDEGNPQIAHLQIVKNITRQGLFVSAQAITFLGFLIAGFIYASAI
ncbi:MAG: hypothetical protein AB1832_13710 [Pseudomonadota bacterium]